MVDAANKPAPIAALARVLLSRFMFVLLVSVDTFANTRGLSPFPSDIESARSICDYEAVLMNVPTSRSADLVKRGADTVQHDQQNRSNLQQTQANTTRAKAALIAAELGIKTLEAQLENASASQQQAQTQLDQAKLNLGYTRVTAAQATAYRLRASALEAWLRI